MASFASSDARRCRCSSTPTSGSAGGSGSLARSPPRAPTTSRSALEGAGFTIVEERQPSFLFEGSVLVTGEVDRTTGYEPGFPLQEAWQGDRWVPDPLVLDDQAVVIHVRDRGLHRDLRVAAMPGS